MSDNRCLKTIAKNIFSAGIQAVDPAVLIQKHLRLVDRHLVVGEKAYSLEKINRLFVIGIGKASAAMAKSTEAVLGHQINDGLIITKYSHSLPLNRCRLMEAGHPIPDENGVNATGALLEMIRTAGPEDLVLTLISGGGSALSPAPAKGITLAEKQETTRALLHCGATIQEINTVRKHLSRLKGGHLCRNAGGATVVSLILSDVIGDDLGIIASGVTAPDSSTFSDCMDIFARYGLQKKIPKAINDHLSMGLQGLIQETPKKGDPVFTNVDNFIIGSISDCLNAAQTEAQRLGFNPLILTSMIQGEAVDVAKVLCAIAKEIKRSNHPVKAPACLLSGGETTVTIKGDGLGGRNMELALAAGIELAGTENIVLLSAGTDGTDGPTNAAGAYADGLTLSRADALGISPYLYLANNNSYRAFEQLGDLHITGPTLTNVMDMQILLVDD